MTKFNTQTFYEILDISPEAAENEIHAAYQRAKAAYSPDSPALYTMFSKDEARQLLRLIEEAYETLSNQARRTAYDKNLYRQKSTMSVSDLPDFEIPNDNASTPAEKEPIPQGFRKTRHTSYKVDANFESEIGDCNAFNGAMLTKIRKYKNLDIDRVSEITRISKNYLQAVENEDFNSLPAPVFVRGFVVQLARVLDLDDQKVANTYMKNFRQK